MSISYSGLSNYGKATLPSIVGGLGSMNILRDPPKSIHTRRINKVGETSGITSMIDDSGNRACEAITQYARGVNPMVGVSYSNNGGGNGNKTGSIVGNTGRGKVGSKLPYRIIEGGSFRPPNIKQFNVYPLSRLPRNTTSANTSKDYPNYMKKVRCPQSAEKTDGVKNKMLKTCVRPTAVYKLEKPIEYNYKVKYVINNPIKINGKSGIRTMDLTSQTVNKPIKEIMKDPMKISKRSTIGTNNHVVDSEENRYMNTERYMQDPMYKDVRSNMSRDVTRLTDNNNIETDRYMQDPMYKNVRSNVSRDVTRLTDNNNIETERYMQDPMYKNVRSNVSRDVARLTDNNNIETERYMQDPMYKDVRSNVKGDTTHFDESQTMDTSRYLQETNHSNIQSQKSRNIQVTPIDEIMNINIKTKEQHNISYITPKIREGNNKYIHDDIELNRKAPVTYANTNIQQNIYKNPINNQKRKILQNRRPVTQMYTNMGTIQKQHQGDTVRDYKLKETINAGGYDGRGQKPMINRINNIKINNETRGAEMSRKVNEQMYGRYKR